MQILQIHLSNLRYLVVIPDIEKSTLDLKTLALSSISIPSGAVIFVSIIDHYVLIVHLVPFLFLLMFKSGLDINKSVYLIPMPFLL